MNFGQHWRGEDVRPFTGTVILPLSFVVERSREFLREFREDAEVDADQEDELEQWLREVGWPESFQVVRDHKAFPLLVDYLGFEFLKDWFGDREPGIGPGYVINTIESATVEGRRVIFHCTGRLAGTSDAYQD